MMRITWDGIKSRLSGFSIATFGLSWTPEASERDAVRDLVVFLEDRRALYYPYEMERPGWVVESVLEIRRRLTQTLQDVPGDADAIPHLRAMRAACREFLDKTAQISNGAPPHHFGSRLHWDEGFFTALGELRARIGHRLAAVCVRHHIDLEGDIVSILPPEDDEGDQRESGSES